MKLLITENQQNKLKTKILNSFEKNGVYKTLDSYSLTPKTLDYIFKNNFPEFDCYDLSALFQYLYFKNFYDKSFSYGFNGKTYMVLSNKRFDGVMEYDIKDPENNDGIIILATPYYEGECFIPVDVTDYFVGDDYYEIWGDDNFDTISPPENFSSFVEFFNWFKNDGMEQMFEIVIPHLEMTRDEYKNGDLT
tara:strand:+ start:3163 stop:3738 length:576 start_codon:yes stop_codon:yes gene_type:complete